MNKGEAFQCKFSPDLGISQTNQWEEILSHMIVGNKLKIELSSVIKILLNEVTETGMRDNFRRQDYSNKRPV